MKFNYLKGLISSALLCSFYVNANDLSCGGVKVKDIYDQCVEDSSGHIKELKLKSNAHVEVGIFKSLTTVEKLTISGEQNYIQQYHFNEISTMTSLKEIHLTYSSTVSTKVDMTVIKKNENISYLELSDSTVNNIKITEMKSIKELNVSEVSLTQSFVNDVGKLPRLNKMSIGIDKHVNQLDFKSFKSMTTLTSLEVDYKESRETNVIDFKGSFKGFTHLTELKLNSVKLSKTDIEDISSITSLKTISFNKCNFSHSNIYSLNKLPRLKNFELLGAQDIEGETLTNSSLEKSEYQVASGSAKKFCISKNAKAISKKTRNGLKQCNSESNGYASSASYSHTSSNDYYSKSNQHGHISSNDYNSKFNQHGHISSNDYNSKFNQHGHISSNDYNSKYNQHGHISSSDYYSKSTQYSHVSSNDYYSKSNQHGHISSDDHHHNYPKVKISTNGLCGHKHGMCPNGKCCSKDGRCGKTKFFCGFGCQSKFGRCDYK